MRQKLILRPNFSNNFQPCHYQQNSSNQVPPPSFQNPQMDTRFSNMERKMDTFNKAQEILIQAMTRLENQFSQQANPIYERTKGTLPSQPLLNPGNFR